MKCKQLFALLTAGVMTAALPQVSLLADVTAVAEDNSENSFKSIAALSESLPLFLNEDRERNKASRGSRYGMTKLTFNFLLGEKLFVNVDDRFYPTDRLHAVAENYFEEEKSLIQEYLEEK